MVSAVLVLNLLEGFILHFNGKTRTPILNPWFNLATKKQSFFVQIGFIFQEML